MDKTMVDTAKNITSWNWADISDNGERVTHLYANDCYYAHLSIYYFASQFCQKAMVLDAGSGAGYGAAYLAKNGARYVQALEISANSVAFSREHFPLPNLHYQVMDLQKIEGFQPQQFDLIYSSNVLEHVPDVIKFFHSARTLLKADGTMVIAVPPIVRDIDWTENINNIYHLNIWTPRQWYNVINLFFSEIQCYHHGFHKDGIQLNFANTPEETLIDEKDFIFTPVSIDEYYQNTSLTVIFVVKSPRPESDIPQPGEKISYVEDSFSRPLTERSVQKPVETTAEPAPLASGAAPHHPASESVDSRSTTPETPPAPAQKQTQQTEQPSSYSFNDLLRRSREVTQEYGILVTILRSTRYLLWRLEVLLRKE